MTREKPGTSPWVTEEAAQAPAEVSLESGPEKRTSSEDSEDAAVSDTESASSVTEPENWIRFSFGPNWAFCLWTQHGARWNIRGQSEAIDAWRALNLKKVFRVTWTVDGGWIITGETKENAPVVAYWYVKSGTIAVENAKRWVERHEDYEQLFDTLRHETADDMEKLRCANWSVGPGGCWWAKFGDKVLEHKIPQALELMMEKKARENIRTEHVALGMYGSYVAFWSDGTRSWSLQGYDGLHEHLQGDDKFVYVALSPVRNDNYILIRKDGCAIWNMESWTDSLDEIRTMLYAYMQVRADTDGTTFELTHTSQSTACAHI